MITSRAMIDQAFGQYEPAPDTGDWRADLVADYHDDFAVAQATYLQHMTSHGSYPLLAAALAGVGLQAGDSVDERLTRILRLNLDGLLPES